MKLKIMLSIVILTLLSVVIMPVSIFAQGAPPDIIDHIDPSGSAAGTTNLAVTINLQDLGTPPVPPSDLEPTRVTIGTLEGRDIARNNLVITAVFDIPANETNGQKSLSLTFPGPNNQDITFTKANAFLVTGGEDGDNPGEPGDSVDVTGDLGCLTYPVVDTGQDKCYDTSGQISMPGQEAAFYGQDGQMNGYQPSYTISSDGLTVDDNVTGLTWTRKADWDGNGTVDADDKFTYADAMSYVATVNANNLGGYNDWRLPSIKELYSLIDYRGTDPNVQSSNSVGLVPFINDNVFQFGYGDMDAGDRIIDSQWATTTLYVGSVMGGQQAMFGVNFADGRIKGYPVSSGPGGFEKTYYLRLCRGNTAYGENDFMDNDDGTVTDNATGLMWARTDNGAGVNWEGALAYAQQMNSENYLGYSDWRLPNAKELQSLLDYSRSPDTHGTAAINPLFNCTQITNEAGQPDYPFYWSSTTFLSFNGSAFRAVYVAFGRGLGSMDGSNVIDVHGAGCQRSDPKDGNTGDYPAWGFGPQGDVQRVFNYVRLVRTSEKTDSDDPGTGEAGDGATLFAPQGSTTTYLMDENEEMIKTWQSSYRPGLSCYLLDDKSLLRTGSLGPQGNSVFGSTGGSGGVVERYDWDGNLIWDFTYSSDNYLLHHDIEYLPNGNILMIAWERKTQAEALAEGRNPLLLSGGELWPDKIIEVAPDGSSGGDIIWEWHVWDHLIQDYDASKSNFGTVSDHPEKINLNFVQGRESADWNHINAVDYNEELDQILLTVHNFSEIWIIDHNTTTAGAAGTAGDLLYRWGNPQAYGQGDNSQQQLFVPHDGHWIEKGCPGEGDILIFNNGANRPDGNYSTVDQVTPPLNSNGRYDLENGSVYGPSSTTWMYEADPATLFFADHISSAQRLSNGNTLICNGPAGTFFEVNTTGDIEWEYVNPYTAMTPQGETNEVFRAVRYDLDALGQGNSSTYIENDENDTLLPETVVLNPNYPNPFNPVTSISFSLPNTMNVELTVYNLQGQKVKTLLSGVQNAGVYQVTWDSTDENGTKVTSGVYICQIIAESQREIRKMSLIK